MSLWAAVLQLKTLFQAQNWLLLAIDIVIIVAAVWVIGEAIAAISRARKAPQVTWNDEDVEPPLPADAR